MNRARPTARPTARRRGQALTEYIVIVAVLVGFVFTPVFPHPNGGGRLSLFHLFVEAWDIYINSFHTVITLPVP